MASRGRGRRGRPLGASQAPPVFYQHALAEAIWVAAVPLHRLVQLVVREVRVTPRDLITSSSDVYSGRGFEGGRPLVSEY